MHTQEYLTMPAQKLPLALSANALARPSDPADTAEKEAARDKIANELHDAALAGLLRTGTDRRSRRVRKMARRDA